jgi:hypothetical protein
MLVNVLQDETENTLRNAGEVHLNTEVGGKLSPTSSSITFPVWCKKKVWKENAVIDFVGIILRPLLRHNILRHKKVSLST